MPRINTNVQALNTQRLLGGINQEFGQSVGRLSSGFRINSAADDAAGLGIANRFRADLRGLEQASRNAEQGKSMLQIAEGGAQRISDIMDRMKELATQAASDNSGDRSVLNTEFAELQSEIDRIAQTTTYQGNNLLDGTFGNALDTGAGSTLLGTAGVSADSVTLDGAAADTYTFSADGTNDLVTLEDSAGNAQTIAATVDGAQGEQTFDFSQFGVSITTTNVADGDGGDLVVSSGAAEILVTPGASGGNDTVSLAAPDLQAATLGLDSGSIDVSSKSNADTALGAIDSAIDSVATALGELGAKMNRIDFARQNTETAIENFSAAESVIRDVDIAQESTRFSSLQIRQQAATSMLAQANAAPQQVLQLLQ